MRSPGVSINAGHRWRSLTLFELALGDWDAAYARFLAEVLPTATVSADALTDAPALLWRIAIAAPETVSLPWLPLARTASACMPETTEPSVQLHHLLALAGVGDAKGIADWLHAGDPKKGPKRKAVVEQFAVAMRALAASAYHRAGGLLQAMLPELLLVGGSRAQGRLFGQLAASTAWRLPVPRRCSGS